MEEFVERLRFNEGIQAVRVQTQGTEDSRQRAKDLSGSRHVLLQQGIENDVSEAVLLQSGKLRGLLEDEQLHNVCGE